MLVNIRNGVTDGSDSFRVFVADLGFEFLLQRHDDFDQVEGVGVKIANELSLKGHLVFVDAKTLGHYAADALISGRQPYHLPPSSHIFWLPDVASDQIPSDRIRPHIIAALALNMDRINRPAVCNSVRTFRDG
jgi:hypothetical protein